MIQSGIHWSITVVDAARNILFAGHGPSQHEIEEVAREARRLRPGCRVLVRPPMGAEPYEWTTNF
jgi:hypothetical protein